MTLVSHQKQFIFIHIYKTAGTTITDDLVKYCCLRDRLAYDYYVTRRLAGAMDRIFNSWSGGRQWLTGYHKHAKAIEVRQQINESCFNQYYKFAFVRNSWDWIASLYFYIKQEKNHADNQIANQSTFTDFIKYYLDSSPRSQLDFLTDCEGNIIVDKIGRFENLDSDFTEILSKVNISRNSDSVRTLEVKNMSMNRDRNYQIYYDSESVGLVADYFKQDIEYFQFKFD